MRIGEVAAVEFLLVVRLHLLAVGRGIRHVVLTAVGVREPPEYVIEAAVLHHHDDDVLAARVVRVRQARMFCGLVQRFGPARSAHRRTQDQRARRTHGPFDEVPPIDCHGGEGSHTLPTRWKPGAKQVLNVDTRDT
jgi:hypothetical protein